MGTVTIYLREGVYIACPEGKTTVGFRVATDPVVCTPVDASPEELGRAVAGLFEHCGNEVEQPSNWNDYEPPVVAAAGVTTWKEFVKPKPRHAIVDRRVEDYLIERWRFDGRGFEPENPECKLTLDRASSLEARGSAVARLLNE